MKHRALVGLALAAVVVAGLGAAHGRAQSIRSIAAFDAGRMARIADVVNDAIAAKQMPGAVVMVGRGDQVVYKQAFGNRAVEPAVEPMTLDTIFDLASLTKVVATTTAVMMLVEDGRVRLSDTVATHIPGFERYGKGDITVRHLLTHVSGLRPDLDMSMEFASYDEAIARAIEEVPTSAPGERLVYSDINFFLLGEIVHRVSGTDARRVLPDADLRAARHARHDVQAAGLPSCRGSRRPRSARSTGGRATSPAARSCAASCTTRRRGGCSASRATPACSAPRPTWRSSAACCSTAGGRAPCGSSRRSPWRR